MTNKETCRLLSLQHAQKVQLSLRPLFLGRKRAKGKGKGVGQQFIKGAREIHQTRIER